MIRRKAAFRSPGGGVYLGMPDIPTITPKTNGPLVVQGPVRIVTPDGRELAVPPRKDGKPAEVVVLCRCGGVPPKPLFFGTHQPHRVSLPPPPAPPPPPFVRPAMFFSSPGGGPGGGPP